VNVDAGPPEELPDALFIFREQADGYPDIVDAVRRLADNGHLRGGLTFDTPPTAFTSESLHFWERVVGVVSRRRTEVIVLHHFHSGTLPDVSPYIEMLQSLPHRPVVAITNGDAYYGGLLRPRFPENFLRAARASDAVFTTSLGVVGDYLYRRTGQPVALMPNGVCQVRFDGRKLPPLAAEAPEFRVVVIGSNNFSRKPWSPYYWYGRKRQGLVSALSRKFGSRFAVFGRGWEGYSNWQGPVRFSDQQQACRRAEVVVGGVPYSPARYYTSDRPFIQIASGVPFVDLDVEGNDRILRSGEHWHLVPSIDQIVDVCDDLLSTPRVERLERGEASMEYLLRNHRVVDRCGSIIRSLVALRQAIVRGDRRPAPDLSFFLPDVDITAELPYATRGWLR
jgi:hypothetical protein